MKINELTKSAYSNYKRYCNILGYIPRNKDDLRVVTWYDQDKGEHEMFFKLPYVSEGETLTETIVEKELDRVSDIWWEFYNRFYGCGQRCLYWSRTQPSSFDAFEVLSVILTAFCGYNPIDICSELAWQISTKKFD